MAAPQIASAPWGARGPAWLTGTVYGALLNHRADVEALGARMHGPPYLAPPKAPILYIKPRNTWRVNGDAIPIPQPPALPAHGAGVQVGATLAVIIGQPCVRIRAENAPRHVAAVTVINDLSLPHKEVFRPAVKERCRDAFCAVGPWVAAVAGIDPFKEHALRTFINGELRATWNTRDLVRSLAQLMADVSEFMTLHAGDVLMVGTPRDAPLAGLGDRVAVEIEGIGRIENTLVKESGAERGAAGVSR
jgi:5-oxopent-3-ene-1,2,5-tricarboxylate decarboxylase/2-hydroxyhepta-2,4-diene-1,7-dioate isomerase